MFKSWRSDKKKIKAVFKLQFQATQVPQLKKPALTISLLPEDVGKTTFKLEKAAVDDGTCLWENPIFVTVKLVRHAKTGKLDEKIYHFIVSSGSSKSGYLGEASIDFADFADEAEPLTVSLPLKFANSGAILHVTVQRVQGGTDQRYNEDYGDSALTRDESLQKQLSNGLTDGDDKIFSEDKNFDNLSLENADQDGSFREYMGSNASLQTTLKQNSMPRKVPVDTSGTKNRLHRRSSTDWSMGSASDGSLVDSTNSLENELQREVRGNSDESIEKLKSEISTLLRQSELSELELQSLRKQIAKESRRAQDLSREIIELKEERDALKTECVQLRSSQRSVDGEALNRLQDENKDLKVQLEEIRRELTHGKEMNSHLKLQLQKTQDSNSELILAVRDLDDMLEQKNMEISHLSVKLEVSKNSDEDQGKKCKCTMKEDENQQAVHVLEESGREQNDGDELCLLKQQIKDLSDEIELYRQDREKLENYIEQLSQEYADLQQENHDCSSKLEQSKLQQLKVQNEYMESLATIEGLELQLKRLEEKLKKQTEEFSESLISIDELESHVKLLEKELEKQAAQFENDLDAMTNAKIEQEQRAIRAEEALRKTRWKNAVTAERLQEEFKRLSVEMSGKFDENEKLMAKATAEATELRVQNKILEERLHKSTEELSLIRDESQVKVEELSTQLALQTKHVKQMSLELEAKSKQLRNAEKQEDFSVEIQMLKANIEMLTKENNGISEQAEQMSLRDETEKMKSSFVEKEVLIERWKKERDELERNFALAKKEAEKLQEELLILSSLKNEKETQVEKLLSEAESVRSQHNKLEHSLSKQELEKQNLQKQVLELKHELQCVGRTSQESRYTREKGQQYETNTNQRIPAEKVVSAALRRDDSNITELLTEITLLKERNKSMESELKEMQERYSEISLKFAEVEGERQQLVMTVRNLKTGKKN
ncbi:hypothetical protein JCGZ_26115 [Jatropha curcas]|uniref:C2 NT-type domain-containing protein n=1 Tax=Jatropha curcas TaxID=180498 RepID=A0A067JRY1_JATCU|nr:A-kinase anchor protein 9 [Jatropha curcas]KDP22284.1 hypothetical protein JCGZ_26115 [Jatropha curcas]